MKEQWTEEEVASFPPGEHDYFERKSGLIFNQPDFHDKLAKVISALANSGGGQILLGVTDDGHFDGVPRAVGRTSTREHLEQIIPKLVDYSLSSFRVHEVKPATNTSIPSERIVIIIDIDDSSHAPHQARHNKVYYYRPGGRSEPAPHFYLEALRNRAVRPVLTAEPLGIRCLHAHKHTDGVFLQILMEFEVHNEGRNLAENWLVDVECRNSDLASSGVFRLSNFPKGGVVYNRIGLIGEQPLLPSMKGSFAAIFGLNIRPETLNEASVQATLDALFGEKLQIVYSVVSEQARTDDVPLDPSLLRKWISGGDAMWALPNSDDPLSLYGGQGIWCKTPYRSGDQAGDFMDLVLELENQANIDYVDLYVLILFIDAESKIIHTENLHVNRLARGASKEQVVIIAKRELRGLKRLACYFLSDKTMTDRNFVPFSAKRPGSR